MDIIEGKHNMRLTDIDTENKLIFRFKYKDKPYSMIVSIITKSIQCLIIPAILDRNQVLDPNIITDAEIIYTVKDGVFIFRDMKLEVSSIMDKSVYLVFSEEDIPRLNRREAYRIFIGEILKISVTSKSGRKRVYEGILKDVSILGMGVILKNDIEIGSVISIAFQFEGLSIPLRGEIIRKEKMNRYRAYTYGCKFEEPNNSIFRVMVLKQVKNKNDNKTEKSEQA